MEIRIQLLLYIFNLISAFIAVVLFAIYVKTGITKIYLIPRNLRLYIATSFIFCGVLQAIVGILFSLYYLIVRKEDDIIFKSLRLLQSISSQHVRGSLFITVVERIIATVFLEKYNPSSNKLTSFWVLTFMTCIFTAIHSFLTIGWIYFENLTYVYYIVVNIATVTHFLTLIVAKILHSQNQKMYKLLAYRVTLKGRHQIFENIKVLKILWPTIVLFTVIAPIGVMLAVFYNIIYREQSPGGLFFLTYNPAFIVIFLYLLKDRLKSRKIIPYSNPTDHLPVISAMGQRLPTSFSTDMYFKELQNQWNS